LLAQDKISPELIDVSRPAEPDMETLIDRNAILLTFLVSLPTVADYVDRDDSAGSEAGAKAGEDSYAGSTTITFPV